MGKNGPFPKLYSLITEFPLRASLEKEHLKGTAECSQQTPLQDLSMAPWCPQKLGAAYCSGWCCSNRSTWSWEDGIWVSSRLPSLPGGLNINWFLPPAAVQAPLPISAAFGQRLLAAGGWAHMLLGSEFHSCHIPPALSHCVCVQEQSFSRLHPSYQSLGGFSTNSWLLMLQFS